MEKWLQVHGGNGSTAISERGNPCCLLHGFCGVQYGLGSVLILLDDRYRLIIPDLPVPVVHRSGLPGQCMIWQQIFFVPFDQEGLDEVVVMGIPWEAIWPWKCCRISERLTGIGLIHSHVYADTEEKKKQKKGDPFCR